ncbi:MAG: Asp-tRNA(Asn)/Glu-tRNA(Gln) amidotransferase subunit GatA [Oligoflexia bacterium]|nr:Asp-tRNA(Asn)/Glu-tRNA(Gln) amidotransferase subunit GatA [Oligoflexia bacterium]
MIQKIDEIHGAFDRREITAVQLTKKYLEAARASRLNSFITLCEERALGQARAADEKIASHGRVPRDSHPLLGIPLGIKDIFTIEGVRTTCASKMLDNYVPPYTATLVERLEAKGAVTLGKTNMDEFAMGGSNENSAYGNVLHPTHPDRVPGGSSGGSAAAVGGGLCVASIGTDTGGSIRLPAHYCGLVGLKPTYGSVSRYGMVAFASSLDQAGPMTTSVRDAAILFDAMNGHDPRDSTSANVPPSAKTAAALTEEIDWKNLKIGVPAEYFVEGLAPEVEASVRAALQWFESKGAKLVPVSLPHTRYSVAVYYIVAVSEASSNLARIDGVRFGVRPPGAREATDLADFYRKARALFGPEVKRRIILGTFTLSSGYADAYFRRACQVRRLIRQDFDEAFTKVDLIAGPVSPTTAFRFGEKSDPLQMYLNDILTIPANLAGLPALSMPCGQDGAGLPIGLHLIAPPFAEAALLQAANAFEQGRRA